MPLILHHAFQTWNNVIESWLYLVKAIRSKGSIGKFGAFLTAALAVVRVESRRFISGTTDTNVPATRARSRLLELVILEKIIKMARCPLYVLIIIKSIVEKNVADMV